MVTKKPMITREEYLGNPEGLHRPYHAQYVSESIKALVVSSIGVKNLKESNDHYFFSDIPFQKWDAMYVRCRGLFTKEFGDGVGGVSYISVTFVLKEAARQLIEDVL